MDALTTTPKPLLFLYLVSHFSSSAATFVSEKGIKGEKGIEMCRKKMVEKKQKDTSCNNQKVGCLTPLPQH